VIHQASNKQTDLLGRIDTLVLMPRFLERLNTLLNACASRGQIYVATSGLRTYAEQDALYAKGKLVDGKWKGPTKAKGGESFHNFGIAVDFAPHVGSYTGKLSPDYSLQRYEILGKECARFADLEWGGGWRSFRDTPHIQFRLPRGVRLKDLDLWTRTSGIEAAWTMMLARS
jgi:peptidoglycan L-alanyl-D-glutamate endopeptidase CwlK